MPQRESNNSYQGGGKLPPPASGRSKGKQHNGGDIFGSRMEDEDYIFNMDSAGTMTGAASAIASTAREKDMSWANAVVSAPRGMQVTIWSILFGPGRKARQRHRHHRGTNR